MTLDDDIKGKVSGKCKVRQLPNYLIDDVLLVEGLKHNLLSIN